MTESAGPSPLAPDLRELMRWTAPEVWQALRSQALFLSGGTGFIGRWLVEALLHADRELGLGLSLTVLSRNPAAFLDRYPHLACEALRLHAGDVTHFDFPTGAYAFAVHAALPVASAGTPSLLDTAQQGCAQIVKFAQQAGTLRLLHISSGAVYGPGAGHNGPIAEDDAWDTAAPANDYTAAKRAEEAQLGRALPGRVVTARCFSFMGPGLSPATGTAAAQFLAQAARGRPIAMDGDGTPVRSYQYAGDMARWLLSLLTLAPAGRPFNVGSEEAVSILDLGRRVHHAAGIPAEPTVAAAPAAGRAGSRYVPAIGRAARELGLVNHVSLDDAIARSLRAARSGGTTIAAP